MTKCNQCRKNDAELLTRWERFTNWMFYRLFPKDIADLSQDKFTQGFTDGYIEGQKSMRKSLALVAKRLYNIDL